jgi:hypothetical protein
MKNHLILIIWVCGILLSSGNISSAQNAPVTILGNVEVAIPGNFTVPVSVTGFTNIGAISLTFDYDYAVIQYVAGTPNPLLSSFILGDADLSNGFHRITMGWFGSATSLADGSVIMTITFNYISGNTELTWNDDGPSCEYADGQYNVLNDVPMGDFYINGYVCGVIGIPGAVTGPDTLCQGTQGATYSIAPLPNATGYNWTVPDGATIISGQGTNLITVDYANDAMSGDVSVFATSACGSGPSASLYIAVYALPSANAGPDQTINYGTSTTLSTVWPGGEQFTFHWSPEELLVDPDVQDPQTVILTTTTIFTVQVTNTISSCINYDVITVFITGGPLSVNSVAIPSAICRGESSQLYANAGGGSENYSYQWTCIPPDNPLWSSNLANPVVSPDSSKHYLLSVNDGFTTVTGSADLNVFQLPTATISGGDTLCGSGLFANLTVDLTGTPPWSFIYSNGITSIFIINQFTTPYIIITADPGTYTILEVEDMHCYGTTSGSATVGVFPLPATPEITVTGLVLKSSSCCGNHWYLNNEPITGATDQYYTATVSGEYFVMVTLNSCSSDQSEAVDIIVGIDETLNGTFLFYPNPAANQVNLQTATSIKDILKVILSSADGRVTREYSFNEGNNFSLDISNLAPGVYFLKFSSKDFLSVEKLIIR